MELKSTGVSNSKIKYEGQGVFGIDAQGRAKTFWFDSWGADAVSIGSGDFSNNNKLTITDSNPKFINETRSFEIKDNLMIMNAKGTMRTTSNGKETPFDITVKYQKK